MILTKALHCQFPLMNPQTVKVYCEKCISKSDWCPILIIHVIAMEFSRTNFHALIPDQVL